MSKFYQSLKNILSPPILGITFLCFLFSTKVYAQPFPVSVNTQLTTPSLPYLADYVSNKPETLRAILLLNDDSRLNYEVILKVRISGQGIELASRADYFSTPINLMYNVPEILTGFELADLFDPNNLDITGMSKSEFLKTGQLPEGIYTICFEAYDINRFDQLPVSNGGCAVASVIEHEPPYLIQPKELTPYTEPTILPFNWHPGHTISFRTEYRFFLYEDIPGWTKDQIILYQAPLYTTEVPTTTYLYSAIDPLLEKGASYFWRVQAYDPAGFELFKNNGFSQLSKFTYGQNCDRPIGLESLTINASTQLIRWVDSSPGTYELRYRSEEIILNSNPSSADSISNNNIPSETIPKKPQEKGKKNTTVLGGNTQTIANAPIANPTSNQFSYSDYWTTVSDIFQQEYMLNKLTPHRYEIQVRRICGLGDVSPWSASLKIDNRQPASPEFLLPPEVADPTELTETLFTANWNYQEEAYFELQVARDTGFAILLPGYENLTVNDLRKTVNGITNGLTYYYRVKAKRGDLQSEWSNIQTVQTGSNTQPNIPSLLALPAQPLNYDGFTANWTGTNMVTLYHLEVARDREFMHPIPGYEPGVQLINSNINDLPISVDLITQGVFYRIRTAGIAGQGYSNIIEVPRQYLPVPIALEPTEINATGFTANWEALPEATEYIIDVSTNANFSEVIPELSNQVVSGTSISFNQYLDPENTTYFYQVRAKIDGRTSGNSNPIVVRDGTLAVVPITQPATQIKKTSFWANWQNLPGINTYALDVATTPDFSEGSFLTGYEDKIVYGESHKVEPVNFASTQYFYRVRAIVDDVYSIYSNDQSVSWRGCYFGPMAMDYSCGIPADPYFNEGLPMIAQLEKGDTIQAGDYLVILKEVNNSSPFSGTGYVAMPFQQVRLNLKFTNIEVDETCRMVTGRMEGTGVGLALISEEIADKIRDIIEVLEVIDNTLTVVEDVLNQISDVLNASESVGSYFTNGLNLIDGTDPIFSEYPYLPLNAIDSLQIGIDCFKNTLSPDCKEDLVRGLQVLQNNLVDHFNSRQQVIFQASADQVYGFDSIVHPAFTDHYQGITIARKPYQIPWKSVQNGENDIVEARMADGSPIPENIRFEDADKNLIPTVIENGIAKLTITGVGDQEAYPIYAVEIGDTIKLAGKLNIVSYDPKPINLMVVPVNGATYPFSQEALSTGLQDIFQNAVVNLSVSVANNFQIENFDGELDAIATDFAKSYTDEMKLIFQNYESANSIEEDTYYIFLLPRFANTNQLGYMPRKKQFGFVNNERLQQEEDRYIKTLAHELAHGAFVLHHTFEQHSQLEGNPTENLLDYSSTGIITHQYQWAGMHDPSRAWTLFDKDEERGQVTIYESDIWIKNLNEIACKKFDYDETCTIEIDYPTTQNQKTGTITKYQVDFIYREIPVEIRLSSINKLPPIGNHLLDISDFNIETGDEFSIISYSFLENDKVLEFTVPTLQADRFIEFFQVDLQDYQHGLLASLPTEKSDEAFRKIRRLPICILKQIPTERRIQYLSWVKNEAFVNKEQELIFLDLIKYNNYPEELYDALYIDQATLWNLYRGIDHYRPEYNREIFRLCDNKWNSDQAHLATIHVGKVPNKGWRDRYWGRKFLLIPEDGVDLSTIPHQTTKVLYHTFIGDFPMGPMDMGNVQPLIYLDTMSLNFLDRVQVVSSDKNDQEIIMAPFFWVADKQSEEESKAFVQQVMAAIEVFTMVDAFKVISTGTKIAKTLAAAELVKGGIDKIIMSNGVTEQLKKSEEGKKFLTLYMTLSVTFDLGTMGVGMVDEVMKLGKKANQGLQIAQKVEAAEIVEALTLEMRIMKMLPNDLAVRLGTDNFQKLQSWISRNWDRFGDEVKVQELLNHLDLIPGSNNPNKYISFLDAFDEADDAFRGWILGGQGTERLDLWKNCFKDPVKAKDTQWLEKLLASSGTSKIDNVNPLDISWSNNVQGHNSTTTAVDFWNDVSKNFLYYTQGSYIFKYDFSTGKLLLGKQSTKEIVGFYEGADNLINVVYQNRPDHLMAKLKRYQGLSGPVAPIINILFNPQIASTPGKTTTILGRLKHRPYLTGDMKAVIDELVSNVKSLDIGAKIGGFNILNISDELYVSGTFWESFNLPWLTAAINRGDEIVAASNPMDLNNIFKNFKDVPVDVLTTPEAIATYLSGLENVDIIKNMTYYGREIKLLSENNFIFNINTKKFKIP